MQKYSEMSKEQLQALKKELDQQYAEIKAQGLALDMSRGKPSVDQLNISMDMMDVLSSSTDLRCETGVDCRNYGVWMVFRKPNIFSEKFLRLIRNTLLFMETPA